MAKKSLKQGNSEASVEEKTQRKVSIGPPKLTRFERARVVGARALQISMGAPLLMNPTKNANKPIDIAIAELEKGVLPMTIRRTLPDGEYQHIPISWLLQKHK